MAGTAQAGDPYSLPWQLRPAGVANAVRSDTAFAFYNGGTENSQSGFTTAGMLLGSYKVTPEFAPLVRLGFLNSDPPAGDAAAAFLNPVLGGTYLFKLGAGFRIAAFLGLAFPLGSGGGDNPNVAQRTAMLSAGIPARSAMDNAMFAMNYLTAFPGIDVAWVKNGWTLQIEATILELFRVKGSALDKEGTRTNFTTGFHVGYFFIPEFSLSGEIRYQGWITTPAFVDENPVTRETLTWAIGPRGHFPLGDSVVFRPGVSFSMALDDPLKSQDYKIVQLDLPIVFK